MPARRKLVRTSRLLGPPLTGLAPAEVRDANGAPLTAAVDAARLAAAQARLAARVAPGTARTYAPYVAAWWSLCERRGAELDDEALLRGWFAAMTTGPHAWSASTTRVALAAVTALLALLDLPSPLSRPGFRSWFDGELLARLAAPPRRKDPLLRRHLRTALAHLEAAAHEAAPAARLPALRDRALLLLGFSAALRRSELAAVAVEDLVRTPGGGWLLRIPRSKTDRQRRGQDVPLYAAGDRRFDALAAVAAWRSAAGIRAGPLFRRIDRHGRVGERALDPTSVRLILARLHLGEAISPHSLRRGFITEARLAGASNVQIRRVSRHKDDRMLDTYTADVDAHVQGPGSVL